MNLDIYLKGIKESKFVALAAKFGSITIVVSALTFITSFMLGKFAGKDVFADFIIYQSYSLIALNFIPLGITGAVVFFRFKIDPEQYSALYRISTLFICPTIGFVSFFVLICFEIISSGSLSVLDCMAIAIFSTLQGIVALVVSSYQVDNRFRPAGYLSIFNSIGYILSAAIILLFEYKMSYMYLISSLVSCVCLIFYYDYSRWNGVRHSSIKFKMHSFLKPIFLYSIPTAIHSSISSFLIVGDRIFLNGKVSNEDLANYGYAALVASVFLFVVNNFANAWGIHVVRSNAGLNTKEIFSKFRVESHRAYFFLALPLPFSVVIYLFGMFLNVSGFSYYITSVILVFSYSIHGVNKFYLGYLNFFHKSNVILITTMLSGLVLLSSAAAIYHIHGFDYYMVAFSVMISAIFSTAANAIACKRNFKSAEVDTNV